MTWRISIQEFLTGAALTLMPLLFGVPIAADPLTASPEASQSFQATPSAPTPQVAPSIQTLTSGTVQQDAPRTPPVSVTPPVGPQPMVPLPLMMQMQQAYLNGQAPAGSTPQNSGEIARQVLMNMANSFANQPTSRVPANSATEAGIYSSNYCPTGDCYKSPRNSGLSAFSPDQVSFGSTGNACRDRILKAAREVAARYRHTGNPFRGVCAFAVRTALQKAGLNRQGALGDAKDMGPNLQRLGFVNRMTSSNPNDAPEGAVLVYGPARRRGCAGKGSIYGHVEVKDFNGLFHYDGTATHNIQTRFGADCRPLIGVYLPGPQLEKSC